MYQLEALCQALCLLLLAAMVSSSHVYSNLRNPTCRTQPLTTTTNLLQGHLLTQGAARMNMVSDMSCSNSIFGCDRNVGSELRHHCDSARVYNDELNSKSLCKWGYEIKWSKVRRPLSMVQAYLTDPTDCLAASGRCIPISHHTSVMAIRNRNRAGRPCRYSYRKEDITIGFRCVKDVF